MDRSCSHAPDPGRSSRRQVLAGGAGICAGVLLAACGSESGGGATKSPASPGTALGPADSVDVGSARVFSDARVVVAAPSADEFVAFSAVCTHAGCVVNSVVEDTVTCPCHGSAFSTVDGSVVHGPATEPLPAVSVVNDEGELRID